MQIQQNPLYADHAIDFALLANQVNAKAASAVLLEKNATLAKAAILGTVDNHDQSVDAYREIDESVVVQGVCLTRTNQQPHSQRTTVRLNAYRYSRVFDRGRI